MKKTLTKGRNAYSIFEEYERNENRIPTKNEFDALFYGRTLKTGESNYYYSVKKKWIAECESNESA
jgi:hypothetical protein